MDKLLRTPLHASHVAAGARLVPFAGYEMPVQYTGVLDEAKATRKSVGLFDVSHMGQFRLRGKNSLSELQKCVTNDLTKLQMGQAQYNLLCREDGGVIDDIIVYTKTPEEVFICVNASNREKDFNWLKKHLSQTIDFVDESDDTALLALQGPNAEAMMVKAVGESARNLKYYWATDAKIFGIACFLARTGYTGEDGFEVYVSKENAARVWDKLVELGKEYELKLCGLGARDTLRLEMGYPLYGHELGEDRTPLESGLQWVVKLARTTPFIGQKKIEQKKVEGLKEKLRAFKVNDKRIARQGYSICTAKGEKVGTVTSGTQSPHLNAPIALGFVSTSVPDSEPLFAEVRGEKIPLVTTTLPFVPSHVKK